MIMNHQRAHIAVVDPACRVAELDSFNRLQDLTTAKLSYHLPCLFGIKSLLQLTETIDGIIILGSGASVHEDHDWAKKLIPWIEKRLAEHVPTLGLCYGHQLLAHILGGKVDFLYPDQSKQKGLRKISFTQSQGFWNGQKEGLFVVSHRETVTNLDHSCEIMASSDEVLIDGFRHKSSPIWGMQCHPEAGPGFLENQGLEIPNAPSTFAAGQNFLRSFFEFVGRD